MEAFAQGLPIITAFVHWSQKKNPVKVKLGWQISYRCYLSHMQYWWCISLVMERTQMESEDDSYGPEFFLTSAAHKRSQVSKMSSEETTKKVSLDSERSQPIIFCHGYYKTKVWRKTWGFSETFVCGQKLKNRFMRKNNKIKQKHIRKDGTVMLALENDASIFKTVLVCASSRTSSCCDSSVDTDIQLWQHQHICNLR